MKKTSLFLAALAAAALAAAPARAEEDIHPEVAPAEDAPAKGRGPNAGLALLLSVAGTVGPILVANQISEASDAGSNQSLIVGLYAGGLLLGPSTGQFYAGSVVPGLVGVGVRTAGAFIALTGLAQALKVDCPMSFGGSSDDCEEDEEEGGGAIALGLLLYTGGALFSVFDATTAAWHWREKQDSGFDLAPTLGLDREGTLRPGMLARLRF